MMECLLRFILALPHTQSISEVVNHRYSRSSSPQLHGNMHPDTFLGVSTRATQSLQPWETGDGISFGLSLAYNGVDIGYRVIALAPLKHLILTGCHDPYRLIAPKFRGAFRLYHRSQSEMSKKENNIRQCVPKTVIAVQGGHAEAAEKKFPDRQSEKKENLKFRS